MMNIQRQVQQGSGAVSPSNIEGGIESKFEDKRNAHTAAEQKRRDAIKTGLEQLHHLIPGCNQTELSHGLISKTSKAQVLQKAIDYVTYLQRDRLRKNQEIAELEKKLAALKIMKENYEALVKSSDEPTKPQVSEEVKFSVFKQIMSTLWESFHASVSLESFQTLSGTIISWLEEYCKPESIKDVILKAVRMVIR